MYQVIHFWTKRTFRSIRQFPDKNQSIGDWFLNKQVPNTPHCFLIHIIKICKITISVSPLLKPYFNKVLIIAVTARSQSNVFSTKFTRVRAATSREKILNQMTFFPHWGKGTIIQQNMYYTKNKTTDRKVKENIKLKWRGPKYQPYKVNVLGSEH